MRLAQRGMNEELAAADLGAMPVNARVALAVRARLAHFARFRSSWAGAMALGAAPAALPTTLSLLASAADDAWWACGDRSVDLSWYTRRALLMGVSAATEVFMLTDQSQGHADTWAFLDRRLEELSELSKRGAEGANLAAAAGAGAGAVAEGLLAATRPCLLGKDGEGLARFMPSAHALGGGGSATTGSGPLQAIEFVLSAVEGAAQRAGLPSPLLTAQALAAQLLPPSPPQQQRPLK